MRCLAAAIAILLGVPLFAQVNSRPTEAPIVSAENDAWYRRGEPVVVSGEFYYPAGPVVFFNGNVMVRTAHYNGVPLYSDTTLEPHSVVLLPIGRGMMQPYERVRGGDLAGTSGSRAPSFPGRSDRLYREIITPTEPPLLPQPAGGTAVIPLDRPVGTTGRIEPVPTAGVVDYIDQPRRGRPVSYANVSVQFNGEKWIMAGPMIPMLPGLIRFSEYKGFPVYAERGKQNEQIYLPLRPGFIAPFTPNR